MGCANKNEVEERGKEFGRHHGINEAQGNIEKEQESRGGGGADQPVLF